MQTIQQEPTLYQLISKASTIKKPEFLTKEEEGQYLQNKYYDGVIKLKDKLLGRNEKSLKTLDEIANALFNLKIASSLSEAENLVKNSTKERGEANFEYTPIMIIEGFYRHKHLQIAQAKNESGDVKYKIGISIF